MSCSDQDMYSHVGTCITPAVVKPGTVVFLAD